MDDKATRKQILHALVASCVQSRLLQARCENNYLNKKNKDAIKKFENLHNTCA
jgi:hypothetical protein